MKNYICWENGFECYNEIDKNEFPDFDDWLYDMLRMSILIEEAN